MKKLLFLLLLIATINTTQAQSGWQQGEFYQYRGSVFSEPCSQPYPKHNAYGYYEGIFQCIRTTVWRQEWRQGYIYLWNFNTGQWYSEWRQGTFWYYTWRNDERFVRM